tara:strand:+ start:200 stop:1540 length:1341 start_codon:yes stop_codon:yes gene_type:complete
MATHDYVLANASGAAFRTDLNNALAAIVSNNSNSSEPATKYAYQWWADTNTGTLKIRNSANNGWVELLQLDGTLTLEDGSASTPALAFRDDLNTGIYSDGADVINIGTGGVERLGLSSTATVFNQSGADVDFRIEGDTEANLFYLDAGNNRIGIGTNAPDNILHLESSSNTYLQIEKAGTSSKVYVGNASGAAIIESTGGSIQLKPNSSADKFTIDTSGRVLINTNTEGHAAGDNLTVADTGNAGITIRSADDGVGVVYFSDGTSGSAEFRGAVQYNHTDNYLRFYANGSETIRFISGGGITFNGDSAANNALNDYEQGSWTPTVQYGTGGFQGVNNAVCRYVKVGNLVHISGRFSLTTSGSGDLDIEGLPFAKGNPSGDGNSSGIQVYVEGAASNIANDIVGLVLDATTQSKVRRSGSTSSGGDVAGLVDSGTTLLVGGTYTTFG